MTARIPRRNRQRGWFGLIVLLVALAIVAFLAKDALKQYGLLSGVGTERKAQASGERLRDPGVSQPSADTSSQPSPPATPIERARELEDTIKRQAQEQAKRIP